ncbi:MAG TPA: sporulation-delaying protein SdpB family protein [Thermoanaerobaculia bacterium]|nr:sporulation-delaying protein SdpB family protein [Thermoanaerobaculia bacterium]
MTLTRIDRWMDGLTANDPCTNVYGVARTLIAASTLLTFVFTDTDVLFRPALGIDTIPICNGLAGRISLFCLLSGHLDVARGIVIVLLATVASGWRPRLTGIIHWWISFSFMSSAILVDGGDQVCAVIALLLVPVTLMDRRRWHWSKPDPIDDSLGESSRRLVALTALTVIRIQVAIIYLHAAVAKCAVAEWMNGTALYYWFTDPMFGAPNWLGPFLMPALVHGPSVTILTWSVIVLEFSLFAGLLARDEYRHALLIAGILFHVGIALIHGLVSFSLTMFGALILLLRPFRLEFSLGRWQAPAFLRDAMTSRRAGPVTAATDPAA